MSYKLGNKWSADFDYDGMLDKGMEANVNWTIENLQLLYNSFEDVNYHSEAGYLWAAIQELKSGNVDQAELDLDKFNSECAKTVTGWSA